MAVELPPSLIQFIRAAVPTYQAAEVLLFLAAHPERTFTPEELVVSIRPAVLTVPAIKQYLALFLSRGLVVERDGAIAYGPASSELEQSIGDLAHAHNERPVTLIKVISMMTNDSLRSFADAFDLRQE
jgi:hypothetical protein